MITSDDLQTILNKQFGLAAFRPGQREAITTLLEQNRLLCIQPTGHGKSLLYQLPSVLLDGVTVVISPLLALMRDQIMQLNQKFQINAVAINSDQSLQENNNAQFCAQTGQAKILFIAPEQLDNLAKFNFLLNLPISLIVVDEAHCISTWGHDFRPSYRQIIQMVRALVQKNSQIKVLGLTATANNKTEQDIMSQLSDGLGQISVHRQSMDRPNIQLGVIKAQGIAEKLYMIEQLLQQLTGNGLIYCATRENTQLVAEYLQNNNINAAAYHAGFASDIKKQLQQDFTNGQYQVIAATNALGMGIDKSDLRYIIHFDVPGSITAYYQEVGRCGRDGLPAQGILLFDPKDKKIQEHFIDSAQPSLANFNVILELVNTAKKPQKLVEIKRVSGLHPTIATVVIAELIEQKFLQKIAQGSSQMYVRTDKRDKPNLQRYHDQYHTKKQELASILNYGDQKNKCRMLSLRESLGDQTLQNCGHCDVCTKSPIKFSLNQNSTQKINSWLQQKTVRTIGYSQNNIAEGISLLDGKLRSPLFVKFMRERTSQVEPDPELLALVQAQLALLAKTQIISYVIPIPSRTWMMRNKFAELIAAQTKAKLLLNYLSWTELPQARQGELLNNDQRRYNVADKMQVKAPLPAIQGTILLLDDYIGSGATIKEAARVLRKSFSKQTTIMPFTLANIKWRLGAKGFI